MVAPILDRAFTCSAVTLSLRNIASDVLPSDFTQGSPPHIFTQVLSLFLILPVILSLILPILASFTSIVSPQQLLHPVPQSAVLMPGCLRIEPFFELTLLAKSSLLNDVPSIF